MVGRALVRLACLFALLAASDAKGPFNANDKNFDSEVLNSGKNAFVKFLAPWYVWFRSLVWHALTD
jgi:hypothetical protein